MSLFNLFRIFLVSKCVIMTCKNLEMGRAVSLANSGWRMNSLRHSPSPALSPGYIYPRTPIDIPKLAGKIRLVSISTFSCERLFAMDASGVSSVKEVPLVSDTAMEEEYVSQSKWLKEFTKIPSLDKAWVLKSDSGKGTKAMFAMSQPNLLENKRRKFVLSAHISEEKDESVSFEWAAFPVEMTGVSAFVPSPSGSKLLIVRNPENESPIQFEIWSASQLESEFQIPQSIHGSVYVDGWFEGISWNAVEDHIAYVAEEPCPTKPTFSNLGYKKGDSVEKDCDSWKGQGDWEDDWGETYAGKRQPALFVIDINSGEIRTIKGISKTLSVGQVIWAPSNQSLDQYLIFVGWSAHSRKLGIKYCYNRPCALYAVRTPRELVVNEHESKSTETLDAPVVNLTQSISSAFFPRFSPDGKFLLFLSAKNSVDSWAHSATESLHKIKWPVDGKLSSSLSILDVVPVAMCPGNGCFPGLYCSNFISSPWLSDNKTMLISSAWRSTQVILSVDVLSGNITRITPPDSNSSWNVLALHGNNIVAVCSSPVDVPKIKYGCLTEKSNTSSSWSWSDISSPLSAPSQKIANSLSSLQFSIMEIPVRDVSTALPEGAKNPFEAIFVSATSKKNNCCDPLIVVIHGGPHSVALSSFSKSLAFLSSMGYSLLIVNYRGSLGFGEEALQSLPGNIGTQDVNDVITAIDHVIGMGLADPSKITLLGGSHGGFLTTHLIGQAPDKFVAAVARNPVCNLALMSGTSDIPDWCYIETFGSAGRNKYTEAPSAEHLPHLYYKSPIYHIEKVKTPTLFLIGAQDLRVPPSNGLQYARTLKEKGVDVKIIVFPKDNHPIDRPQSDFESFLNVGVWFKKYCT